MTPDVDLAYFTPRAIPDARTDTTTTRPTASHLLNVASELLDTLDLGPNGSVQVWNYAAYEPEIIIRAAAATVLQVASHLTAFRREFGTARGTYLGVQVTLEVRA